MSAAILSVALALPAGAVLAQEAPPRPFESLSDSLRARSTYIFRFDEEMPPARVPARAEALSRAVGGQVRHTYTTALKGFAATMPSTALLRLLDIADDVVAVERDSVDYALAKPGRCEVDPGHPSCGGGEEPPPPPPPPSGTTCTASYGGVVPWGVDRVDAELVHGQTCGEGVHVYVLDSGIDMDHPDLAPIDASVDCTKRGCSGGGDDKNGHGTHVAGTIAARANGIDVVGVAPGATLHSVRVLGGGGIGFRSDIIAGIDWVAAQAVVLNRPVVANMSLGGSGSRNGGETCGSNVNTSSWNDSYHAAICNASKRGVIFAVAAGNEGDGAGNHVPAAYDDTVITVSATDDTDRWPWWSNYGPEVDIAAPGVDVLSTARGGGTTRMSGTSMATPHVAGAVALYLQNNALSADFTAFQQALAALLASGEPLANVSNHSEDLLDAAALAGP